jgi:DNA-binding MarR family transcriptional regulator
VTRQPHPGDRRATLVSFTEHGQATAKALAEDHRALARILFAGMSAERFDALVGGLGEVLDRLRAELPDPSGGRP